ncbi:MAG: C39 family peptidase, partial [Bacteroidota bacterium]|nr:C39 family peptidase [Bacteroidota bacterium]
MLISGVPSYIWKHGCAPTALGMVVGYYDSNGYPDLISGSATTQTTAVDDAMANTQHYNDYSLPEDSYPNLLQDKSELGGAHASNCLADYIKTSFSSEGNYYGWSYNSKIDDGFLNYASQQNSAYQVVASYNYFSASSWTAYKTEIDNNRPVVLLVDSDGNGSTDHFVTGIGYDDSNNNYAIYDTWDNSIHWYTWQAMSSSYAWGIYGFNKFVLTDLSPINENSQNIQISIYPNPACNILTISSQT